MKTKADDKSSGFYEQEIQKITRQHPKCCKTKEQGQVKGTVNSHPLQSETVNIISIYDLSMKDEKMRYSKTHLDSFLQTSIMVTVESAVSQMI